MGITSCEEVIAWADGVIDRTGDPLAEILEISLSAGKMPIEIASILYEIGKDADADEASETLFCRFVANLLDELETG